MKYTFNTFRKSGGAKRMAAPPPVCLKRRGPNTPGHPSSYAFDKPMSTIEPVTNYLSYSIYSVYPFHNQTTGNEIPEGNGHCKTHDPKTEARIHSVLWVKLCFCKLTLYVCNYNLYI